MRKRLKLKKRSCPMCKPHKMRGAIRFKTKELDIITRSEKEIKEASSEIKEDA